MLEVLDGYKGMSYYYSKESAYDQESIILSHLRSRQESSFQSTLDTQDLMSDDI